MQREKTPEWREKQKSSRGIRRGQRYRLVFQFPIRELPGGLCPQPLTAQACRHGFYVKVVTLSTQFIRQAWCTVTLF